MVESVDGSDKGGGVPMDERVVEPKDGRPFPPSEGRPSTEWRKEPWRDSGEEG